jgi:hypothetical protein
MKGTRKKHNAAFKAKGKRSARSACRWAPVGGMISGWRIEQNKCPLPA